MELTWVIKRKRKKSSAPKFSGGLYPGEVGHEQDKNHSAVPYCTKYHHMQMEHPGSVKAIRTHDRL